MAKRTGSSITVCFSKEVMNVLIEKLSHFGKELKILVNECGK